MFARLLIAALALFASAAEAHHDSLKSVVYITGVTVVNPERTGADAVQPDSTIIIHGNRIDAVLQNAAIELTQGAQVIDGRGKWVIPGLIDGHVHFFQSGNLYTRPDAADFNAVVPYADEVARNKARLKATFKVWLANGVTGVVDIGGPFWNFDMRDEAGATAEAPRVAVAGPLISMVDDPPLDLGDPPIIKIETPEAGLDLVKRELARNADYIKVWFIYRPGDDVAKNEAIVKAAGDAAHAAGKKLAVHATELVVAKAALRAGADYLVHSVKDEPVDQEFLDLARRNKALYCPTLFVFTSYELALSNQWRATPEELRRADPEILDAMDDLNTIPADKRPARAAKWMQENKPVAPPTVAMQNLRKVADAGIPIVMGTDAGNIGVLHGPSILREMRMMQDAGLTPLEVLRSATINGAIALGKGDELGVIAAGRLADLVILDADPLKDTANLGRIKMVIKDGVIYDPEALMDSIR